MDSRDNRTVALIKSLETKNRFYALVTPESGIRNAETVERIPEDLLLGIAYPCLEDGLNDFAVIRTTFETLDYFPEDDPVRDEMMEIISDARGNLTRRLKELRDRIRSNTAIFLGTDYNEFKSYALDMAIGRGYPRRNLDSMMKLNVFSMVAQEGGSDGNADVYRYEFAVPIDPNILKETPARDFIVLLFEDVLHSVLDDANYTGRFMFDKNVFQKFIAVMFVNYATTDPMFYGINRQDYAVSADKDMDQTPLYVAIRKEITEIEERKLSEGNSAPSMFTSPFSPPVPSTSLYPTAISAPSPDDGENSGFMMFGDSIDLPAEIKNEEALMGSITSLCSAAKLLLRKNDPDTERFARLILTDAVRLVDELKRLHILPPQAINPGLSD